MGTSKLGAVISTKTGLNPFQVCLVGADRARQIMRGSRPMVKTEANHPTSIVLEEFDAHMIEGELKSGEEAAPWPGTLGTDDAK